MKDISIVALGGQDERGKNCYFIEIKDSIYIFNLGIKMPINGALGVKMVAPNFSYLLKNQNKIKGVFIGNSIFSNIGGLGYFISQAKVKINIYTSLVGKTMIETYFSKKLKNMKFNNYQIHVVEHLKTFNIGEESFTPFRLTNYCPFSLGWVIKNKNDKKVVFIDDFFLSNDKGTLFYSNLNAIKPIIGTGVDILMVGLGAAGKYSGYTSPSYKTDAFYDDVIKNAKGRVLIALNDYNVYNILMIANIAKKFSKPFIIYGSTFIDIFNSFSRNKLFNPSNLLTLPISEINNSDNAIIVVSDTEEELYKKLFNIVDNNIPSITLNSSDTFVLGTYLVPGYESHGAKLLDQLAKKEINSRTLPKNYLPLIASDEDHKFLVNLLNPKFILPIEGLYMNFIKYSNLMTRQGFNKENINFLSLGEKFVISKENKPSTTQFIKDLSETYINDLGNLDSGLNIIKEREQMSSSGIITCVMYFSKYQKMFLDKYDFDFSGLVSNEKDETFNSLIEIFKVKLNKVIFSENQDNNYLKTIKNTGKKILQKIIEKKTQKTPLVLFNIVEV